MGSTSGGQNDIMNLEFWEKEPQHQALEAHSCQTSSTEIPELPRGQERLVPTRQHDHSYIHKQSRGNKECSTTCRSDGMSRQNSLFSKDNTRERRAEPKGRLRALKTYIRLTESTRRLGFLFISFDLELFRASKLSLTRLIRFTALRQTSHLGRTCSRRNQGTFTRPIATSWAEKACASTTDISRAATLPSANTSIKHYKVDFLSLQSTPWTGKCCKWWSRHNLAI